VVDGETGLLVGESEPAWFGAVGRLIADAGLRSRIQAKAGEYVRQHYNQATTDTDWMSEFEQVRRVRTQPDQGLGRNRSRPEPRGARLLSTAFGLARQAVQLSARLLPMLRQNGLRDTGRRVRGNLAGFAQMMAWEVSRWRLQHRMSGRQ
jgi:hypothetical protein